MPWLVLAVAVTFWRRHPDAVEKPTALSRAVTSVAKMLPLELIPMPLAAAGEHARPRHPTGAIRAQFTRVPSRR